MSKKNKKGKKAKYYTGYFYQEDTKLKKAKNKKKNSSYYEKPKFKSIKPTLGKDEAKDNKKIVCATPDIPAKFTKRRNKCNHSCKYISVAEFKKMSPNYAAYTPMLDSLISEFGENSVKICKTCYDVVVDPSAIINEERAGVISSAVASLYAIANAVISNKRMKPDEIKEFNALKDTLQKWDGVIDEFLKLVDEGRFNTISVGKHDMTDEEIARAAEMLNTGGNPTVL